MGKNSHCPHIFHQACQKVRKCAVLLISDLTGCCYYNKVYYWFEIWPVHALLSMKYWVYFFKSRKFSICRFGIGCWIRWANAPFIFLRKVNHWWIMNEISTNGTISNVFNASLATNGMVARVQNVRHLKIEQKYF